MAREFYRKIYLISLRECIKQINPALHEGMV